MLSRSCRRKPTRVWPLRRLLPESRLGKAVSYLLNEYEALIGYLLSGRYQIDNNLVENSIRIPAVGRRRWLFIGRASCLLPPDLTSVLREPPRSPPGKGRSAHA